MCARLSAWRGTSRRRQSMPSFLSFAAAFKSISSSPGHVDEPSNTRESFANPSSLRKSCFWVSLKVSAGFESNLRLPAQKVFRGSAPRRINLPRSSSPDAAISESLPSMRLAMFGKREYLLKLLSDMRAFIRSAGTFFSFARCRCSGQSSLSINTITSGFSRFHALAENGIKSNGKIPA